MIQPGEHRAGQHGVAFVHRHLGDPAGDVERQRDFAHLDVAIEREPVRGGAVAVLPPPRAGGPGRGQDQKGDDEAFAHGFGIAGRGQGSSAGGGAGARLQPTTIAPIVELSRIKAARRFS